MLLIFLSASSPDTPDHFEIVASHPVSPGMTAREMFKSLTAYIKCEVMEMRETAVVGMGHINPPVFQLAFFLLSCYFPTMIIA